MLRLLPIVAVLILTAIRGNAAIIVAASASRSDVTNAIQSAANFDTVIIPPGEPTYTSPVIITKPITVLGSGTNSTIITEAVTNTAAAPLFQMYNLGTNFGRISNFKVIGTTVNGGSDGLFRVGRAYSAGSGVVNTNTQWRIDHLDLVLRRRGITTKGGAAGLIDHVRFSAFTAQQQQGVSVWGDNEIAWGRAQAYGTTNWTVYVEDCVFDWHGGYADSAMDAYGGGRYVARYNVTTNVGFGCHGLDSGSYRSPVMWEIYMNTYSDGYGLHAPRAIGEIRGGTGFIFSNTCYRSSATSPKTLIDTRYARASFGNALNTNNAKDGLPPFQFTAGKRTVTDAIITNGSFILISTQAQFRYYRDMAWANKGLRITGLGIPAGTYNNTTNLNGYEPSYIFTNESHTTITMSQAATQTIVGATITFVNPWDNVTNEVIGAPAPYDVAGSSYGYPALDQTGAAPPTFPVGLNINTDIATLEYTSQAHQPAHQWGNIMINNPPLALITNTMAWSVDTRFEDDTDNNPTNHPNVGDIIQVGRDVINWDGVGGSNGYPALEIGGWYVPLVYPHPLASASSPPTITPVGDVTINKDGTSGPLNFTIFDLATAPDDLDLISSSSDTNILPLANIIFGGTGSNRTVTVNGNNVEGFSSVTITVVDDDGESASTSFLVTAVGTSNAPPLITAIGDITLQSVDASTPALDFDIGDAETPPNSLILSKGSSDPVFLPTAGITFGGTGSERTVTVTPGSGLSGSGTVTIGVMDGGGLTNSTSFKVTRLPPFGNGTMRIIIGP